MTEAMDRTEIVTFGCRLNTYESEVIRRHARDQGLEDAVVINTCAVTAEAERQARQAIRKARRARPGARIVVTGCAAQINPASYAAMPEVDRVLGNQEKLDPVNFAPSDEEPVRVNDIMEAREIAIHLVAGFEGRARAFVQVQNGCDHRCSFCIIPYGRGNSRSAPLGPIVEQVRTLVEGGYREIVATGVDITSYGADLPGAPTLGSMVRRLLDAVPELDRLRLTSLDPVGIDDDLFALIADEPRLMPHLHLSLQAGDDTILKRMKRRHDRADAIEICDRLRAAKPDLVFGADLIAGFPTETEAMFEKSLELVEACGLTYLHVFPFSARPGTPAARMPAVAVEERKARTAKLRAAGEAAFARHLKSRSGKVESVLMETEAKGRTESFAPIRLAGGRTPGEVVKARVRGVADGVLVGDLIERAS